MTAQSWMLPLLVVRVLMVLAVMYFAWRAYRGELPEATDVR